MPRLAQGSEEGRPLKPPKSGCPRTRRCHPRGGGGSPHQVGEGHIERVGDKEQIREAGVTLARFVPLDAAPLHPDAVGELVLREAGGLPVGSDALA